MAYAFDETFATGIPAGFAAVGGAGGIIPTWNSAQQAVDLVFTQAQNVWKIVAAQQASDFWFEIDVEIVALSYSSAHFGIWLWDGVGSYEGHRVAVWNAAWVYSAWTAGASEFEAETGAGAAWALVGARKTLRIEAKRSADGIWALRLTVDGVATAQFYKRNYATFLPGVFGYGLTLRLHRAAGGTTSSLPDAPRLAGHGFTPKVLRRILVPEHAEASRPASRGLRLLTGTRNAYYAGPARIAGTVKEKGSPADQPVSRRVFLLDEATHILVRATWSDATTGAYAFEHLNPDIRYLVVAYDYKNNYRAVIADHLVAEVPP
jgi:hypothetical protein